MLSLFVSICVLVLFGIFLIDTRQSFVCERRYRRRLIDIGAAIQFTELSNKFEYGIFTVEKTGVLCLPYLVWFCPEQFHAEKPDKEILDAIYMRSWPYFVVDADPKCIQRFVSSRTNWRVISAIRENPL